MTWDNFMVDQMDKDDPYSAKHKIEVGSKWKDANGIYWVVDDVNGCGQVFLVPDIDTRIMHHEDEIGDYLDEV